MGSEAGNDAGAWDEVQTNSTYLVEGKLSQKPYSEVAVCVQSACCPPRKVHNSHQRRRDLARHDGFQKNEVARERRFQLSALKADGTESINDSWLRYLRICLPHVSAGKFQLQDHGDLLPRARQDPG